MIKYVSRTDKGLVRSENEDSFNVSEVGKYLLIAIADGLGGVSGGEIASKIAIQTAVSEITHGLHEDSTEEEIKELLRSVFQTANVRILLQAATDPDCSDMATTLTVAIIKDSDVYIEHIGDCRVYIQDASQFKCLTTDHTYAQQLVNSESITKEEVHTHPGRNILLQYLGENVYVTPDFYRYNIENGEVLLICTDGLSSYVEDRIISDIVSEPNDLEKKVDNLVAAAYNEGAPDNITVVLATSVKDE